MYSDRRSFVKLASTGAGALMISGNFAYCTPFHQQKQKLGIALVGLGYYSTQVLAPALQETQECYLAGIVTGTPEKEKIWADKYNIQQNNIYNYDNYDQIKDNPDIDIIYVVLPNSMHHEYTIRAAEAGKHVICEKPMASSVQECKEMIEACKRNNRLLSIGYRMHFEPHTQHIMKLGQEEVFGQVLIIGCGAGYRDSGRPGHWKMSAEYSGGALMDMGVYAIQGARYVTGKEPIAATAQSYITRPDYFDGVDETTTIQLEFPGGTIANLHTSLSTGVNYLHAACENGRFKLEPFSSYRGIKGYSSKETFDFPDINQQAAQMDDFAVCVKENKVSRVPGEEGLKDLIVIGAVKEAIKEGRRVEIK